MQPVESTLSIDINCDLGEAKDEVGRLKDAQIMPYLSSCNIACGGHAGDLESAQISIENALKHQLKLGAHPSYPDKQYFGRRSLKLTDNELFQSLRTQLEMIIEAAAKKNTKLHHLKFHGALYNDLEKNSDLCQKIADFLAEEYHELAVYGLANGALQKACSERQLRFAAEGFIDRSYQSSGQLTPRSQANAVFTDRAQCISQAVKLARGKPLQTACGHQLVLIVDTLCLHGDNSQALTIARAIHQALIDEGIMLNHQVV